VSDRVTQYGDRLSDSVRAELATYACLARGKGNRIAADSKVVNRL